jgi:hypothetical protein
MGTGGTLMPLSPENNIQLESGDDLCSRAVASQVLSTREGLTSVFGMGTGGTPQPLSPEIVCLCHAPVFLTRFAFASQLGSRFQFLSGFAAP